ncbi:hypothetical protein [Mesorhizobium xinjiangense]|uniref:hypothetical protein n=1 Tax=Mesorhizobium xinjiangense TaxID=2678685 RepID=UPI0012EDD8DD|nr:hypothetical protein [Mesorhizobium xinjiangense]
MNERSSKRSFASRPRDPDRWIRAPEHSAKRAPATEDFTARLTIDVTADMRGRIKIAAFQSGQTVADMLRALFEREFPPSSGEG